MFLSAILISTGWEAAHPVSNSKRFENCCYDSCGTLPITEGTSRLSPIRRSSSLPRFPILNRSSVPYPQPEGHVQPGHAPLPEDANSDRPSEFSSWSSASALATRCSSATRSAPDQPTRDTCAHSDWRPAMRLMDYRQGFLVLLPPLKSTGEQKFFYFTRQARKNDIILSPRNLWERRVPTSYSDHIVTIRSGDASS